jgi:hypothetical protein
MDLALLVPIVGQTMFRPLLTALVTSKQELDAALDTADQITVEGDDELLSYAVSKAANDPGNRVSVEIGEQSVTVEPVEALQRGVASIENPFGEPADSDRTVIRPRPSPGGRRSPPARITEQLPAPQEAPRRPYAGETLERKDPTRLAALSLRRGVIVAAAAVFVALLGIGAAIGWFWFGTKAPIDRNSQVEFHPLPAPSQPSQPPTPSDFWANLPSLLWPAVAIVAIVALFLIARQAISTGSNVTIQWKVTEKVSGRVVITKVRQRSPRNPKAA